MQRIKRDLCMYKGQTYSQNIRFKNKTTKEPISLDGIVAKAQIRPKLNTARLIAELICTVYPDEGKINLALDPDVTGKMKSGSYFWDMQLTDADTGKIGYMLQGKFVVTGRVTL